MKKKKPAHYVDNKKFYQAMSEYKEACEQAERQHDIVIKKIQKELLQSDIDESDYEFPECEYPRIPEYIGKCLFLIATRLSNSPKFYSYSYKDEMIADGYEDCVLRIKSFNHREYTNPFAYFTQISYFAFVRRIKKEQKQTTIKNEVINNANVYEIVSSLQNNNDDREYANTYLSFLQENSGHIETDAEKEQSKRKVVKKTTKAYQKKLKEQEEFERQQKERDELIELNATDEIKVVNGDFESIDNYYQEIEDE